jgi:hypothetical protein
VRRVEVLYVCGRSGVVVAAAFHDLVFSHCIEQPTNVGSTRGVVTSLHAGIAIAIEATFV